ncbi:DUF5934 domain-containing protein (plasmid) [Acinetobacter baumannii]|uniref:TraC family protein n=1 Tax=Acinetobacter baumannii TaxID=470 RepID=UPI003B42F911
MTGNNKLINFRAMLANWFKVHVLGDDPTGKKFSTVDLTNKILESYGMYQIFKYNMFNVKRSLYYNDGPSVSFALEIIPQTGSNEDFVSRIVSIISSFPAETGIQILNFGNTIFEDDLQEYLDLRVAEYQNGKVSDFAIEFAKNRIKHIQSRKGRPQFGRDSYYVIKKPKIILSVTRSGSYKDPQLIKQMEELLHQTSAQLQQAKLPNIVLTPMLLLKIIKPMLDPESLFRTVPPEHEFQVSRSYYSEDYNRLESIKSQLTPRGHSATVGVSEIVFGQPIIDKTKGTNRSVRVYDSEWIEEDDDEDLEEDNRIAFRGFGVMRYPKFKHLYEMGNVIGDFFENSLQYPCPYIISMGIHILDKTSSETKARIKQARSTQNAESKMAKWQPEYAEIARDWNAITYHLHKGGGMCELYHTIGIFAPRSQLDSYSANVDNLWKSNGFSVMPLSCLQLPLLYSSMPMILTKKARDDLKKLKLITTKTTINAVDMMPILSEWQGFGKPVIMVFGRRGTPCFFDLFSNKQGNYNFYICGTSGAGKSVFSLEILAAYKSLGFKIYIIDVGRSFKNFVALGKGQAIDFAKREKICMNPFTWLEVIEDEELSEKEGTLNTFAQEMKMLLPMYAKMASPSKPLDDYDKALLSRAIRETWLKFRNNNGVDQISDFLKEIRDQNGNIDARGWALGTQLENFKTNGMYGSYFNGKANIDMNNEMIYLELEELKDSPELKTVVLFGVMNRIMRDMYLSRSQGKIVFVDEAWQLLDDTEETAAFIEEGYRRARKYFGSFGMGTQGIDDAFANDAARAAYNSSAGNSSYAKMNKALKSYFKRKKRTFLKLSLNKLSQLKVSTVGIQKLWLLHQTVSTS